MEMKAATRAVLDREYHNGLVYVTKACNLRCPRCFLRGITPEARAYAMTPDQFERILASLKAQDLVLDTLHFTGGEPTLWPPLRWAIERVKAEGLAQRVRVVTNGIDRSAADYGAADIVHISHYGALNRRDIARLKGQLGRRCKVQYTVHLPWPFPRDEGDRVLPADCGCVNLAFVGDRVYPCGLAAALDAPGWVPVDGPYFLTFLDRNPRRQDLCRTCISNRRNKVHYMEPVTLELGVWDSPISMMVRIPAKLMGLRKLYRRCMQVK